MFLALNDEAYHSLYGANPSLGYYDPPADDGWDRDVGADPPRRSRVRVGACLGFIVMFAARPGAGAPDHSILRRARRLDAALA